MHDDEAERTGPLGYDGQRLVEKLIRANTDEVHDSDEPGSEVIGLVYHDGWDDRRVAKAAGDQLGRSIGYQNVSRFRRHVLRLPLSYWGRRNDAASREKRKPLTDNVHDLRLLVEMRSAISKLEQRVSVLEKEREERLSFENTVRQKWEARARNELGLDLADETHAVPRRAVGGHLTAAEARGWHTANPGEHEK